MARVGRYVKMSAQPGQGEALATLMLQVAGSLNATPGCELYAINRAVGDPDVVWVTELWASQQALDDSLAVLRTEEGRARLGEVQALLAGAPERTDLEPLGGVGLGG
ncbi:MAG: putative quinol monooxygenase [Solirubrobacteraceae bacterium]